MSYLALSAEKIFRTTLISEEMNIVFPKIYFGREILFYEKLKFVQFKFNVVGWKVIRAGCAKDGHTAFH